MSIYSFSDQETDASVPATGDEFIVYDSSAGATKKATCGNMLAVGEVVSATASTLTVTQATHGGRTVMLDRAGGVAVTLPAAAGTGTIYRFFVKTTFTSDGTIKVANATDVMQGTLGVSTDAAGVVIPTASTSDTITMNGTTTGGVAGSYVQLIDMAAGFWSVSGGLVSTGTEATPFSATVS